MFPLRLQPRPWRPPCRTIFPSPFLVSLAQHMASGEVNTGWAPRTAAWPRAGGAPVGGMRPGTQPCPGRGWGVGPRAPPPSDLDLGAEPAPAQGPPPPPTCCTALGDFGTRGPGIPLKPSPEDSVPMLQLKDREFLGPPRFEHPVGHQPPGGRSGWWRGRAEKPRAIGI